MPEVHAHVTLLAHTPDPLALLYASFRQCYHPGFVGDMWEGLLNGEISEEKQAALVETVLASGHTSPVEHVTFTFAIEGISRALSHQLVRHRIASYSQQSQRYVDGSQCNYILPPAIARNPQAKARFEAFMGEVGETYRELKALLEADGRGGKANEDARFVLPQAAETRLVATMNCRSLLNFFAHRCCTRAQWEIRKVAHMMLDQCREILPQIFAKAGAPCERLGYCPEAEKFSCGRFPTRKKVS